MNKNSKILIGIGILILAVGLVWILSQNSKKFNSQNDSVINTVSTIPPATQESPTFFNTIWSPNSIDNKDLLDDTLITVQFDNQGRVTGYDGCNSFNSSYTLDGLKISINPNMVSTRKACSGEIMNQADTFTKLLIASTEYKLGDGVMVLVQGEKEGLSFLGVTNSLAKTSWDVTGYNNGKEAVVGPITGTNPTIIFGDDGTISGNAGCNTFSGTYSLKGESISIGTLATTQRECIEPEGITEQESSFLTYLQKADTWLIQGDMLYLRTAEDSLAVVLKVVPRSQISNIFIRLEIIFKNLFVPSGTALRLHLRALCPRVLRYACNSVC